MPEHIRITDDGGVDVEVAHRFSEARVIVKHRGIFIFADRIDVDSYELSGKPALTPDEKAIHARLVSTVETTTTITKDDES